MLKRRNWEGNDERFLKKTKTDSMEKTIGKIGVPNFDLSEYREALQKFSETSKQQIISLMVDGGLDAQAAISTLLEKLR